MAVRIASDDEPESKRRKSYTKREALEKLKECENNVSKAMEVMVSDLIISSCGIACNPKKTENNVLFFNLGP